MTTHVDVDAYWKDLGPRLRAHIDRNRNGVVENALMHGLALFSFVQDTMPTAASRNRKILEQTGIMVVLVHDVLRGLWAAQTELSPVAVAALFRTAMETRCNFLFISRSATPDRYASLYARYFDVERVLHEIHRPLGGLSMLSPAEDARIRRDCPEWFQPNGKVIDHWTADRDLKSLKKLAGKVGLENEYHLFYGLGSKYIHGSSLLTNLYSRQGQLGAIANPAHCSQMSLLAVKTCIDFLREVANFFGLPSFEDDLLRSEERL